MLSINEELEAAKAANAALNTILTAARKSEVLATLNKAYRAAVLNLSSGGLLNESTRHSWNSALERNARSTNGREDQ
jgi:hypothetical protein